MKVTVAVKGRFHAFHLARELAAGGALARLITSMPRFAARASGVPARLVKSLVGHEVVARASARLPRWIRPGERLDRLLHESIARAIARNLSFDADMHVIWSGVALPAIRAARRRGAIAVVERGSSHIVDQRERLDRAARAAGTPLGTVPEYAILRELAEYDEADFISVPGSFVADTFVARGFPAERLLTVPYGVDLARFAPAPRHPDRFRILFCGSASIQKGSHHLLRAFSELDLEDAELVFVGPHEPALDAAMRRYRDDRVRFLGPQRDAIPGLYRSASVFAIPSVQDGFPLAHLEAMASGLPVIGSRSSGCVDTIRDGENGFLIDAGDINALKDRLRALHADRDRCQRMGHEARRTATEHSWERYGERVRDAYRDALALGPRRSR